jgi:hypothetical protein
MAPLSRKSLKPLLGIGMTSWKRSVRKTSQNMAEHLGGADFISEPESLVIRRIAVFEAEMNLMEEKIAQDRHQGVPMDEKFLDLYSRLANAQRRFLESVGMKRVPRDVTPSLEEYVQATAVKEPEA